ncbi:PAS domain-containing protein [bacterium]|nr:MAG: PAS domain-containing protein [bacterium]
MANDERVLSDRERTVLLLASEGLTDKEIARSLNLSRRTIGTYWERMRAKLGPFPRTQLVAKFLRHSGEPSYGGLFQAWEDGVWILKPTGETVYANPRVAGLFDLGKDETVGQDMRDRFEAATGHKLDDVIERAGRQACKFELRFERKEGHPVYVEMRASPLGEEKGRVQAVVLLLSDVTTLKLVTRTLDTCDATLAFVSEVSCDLIARFDAQLVCRTANLSLLKVVGKPKEEVEGQPLEELGEVFQPVVEWKAAIQAALDDGLRSTITARLPDGSPAVTYLFPEPTEGFQARTVMSLTRTPLASV